MYFYQNTISIFPTNISASSENLGLNRSHLMLLSFVFEILFKLSQARACVNYSIMIKQDDDCRMMIVVVQDSLLFM